MEHFDSLVCHHQQIILLVFLPFSDLIDPFSKPEQYEPYKPNENAKAFAWYSIYHTGFTLKIKEIPHYASSIVIYRPCFGNAGRKILHLETG